MRVCWRTRPEVRKHLSSPGVPCGEFLDSGVKQTCSRAWQPHAFCPGKASCTVLMSFDILVTGSWPDLLSAGWAAKQQCGDSSGRPGLVPGGLVRRDEQLGRVVELLTAL